ncbi:MAG: amino acid adenylation domain-containing protein, partial [Candidatus Magnetoglobus multicellularis str. Araruama]
MSTDHDETIPAKTIERRPLDVLLAMGEIAPVNSGSIVYLNEYLLDETGMQKQDIIQKWFNNSPVVSSIINTASGSIAVTTIPMFSRDLYINPDALVVKVLEATKLLGLFGAKVVSLTGTIPSATDYGKKIISNCDYNNQLPFITTGHETTTATVLMTIEKILASANRKIENETIGFLGLGSVGSAALKLMVRSLPFPGHLILCDLYTKSNELEKLKQDLIHTYHFNNKISIVASSQNIPDEFYHSSFIVGATNVPDILDINKVKPG